MSPKTLYHVGPLNLTTSLLEFSREQEILVTTNPCNIPILNKESIRQIKESGKSLIHTGLK